MHLPERINRHLHELSDADKSIWRFIESHKETACRASIHDLARLCAVSSASVVRFAQKLGFAGFGEMKAMLKMELEERGKPDRDILTSLSQFYDQSWRELMARDYRGASRLVHEAHRVFAYASGYVQTNVMQELKRLFLYDNVFICEIAGREEFYSVYQTAGPDDLFVFISLSGESERVKEFSEKLNLKGCRFSPSRRCSTTRSRAARRRTSTSCPPPSTCPRARSGCPLSPCSPTFCCSRSSTSTTASTAASRKIALQKPSQSVCAVGLTSWGFCKLSGHMFSRHEKRYSLLLIPSPAPAHYSIMLYICPHALTEA